jgi:hypothetical protein
MAYASKHKDPKQETHHAMALLFMASSNKNISDDGIM